ncbi:putative cytochrome P450 [Trypanosoma cruzi]|nr:putative cytochrome P450 [Trypanosoma cruzi]
MRLTPFRGQLSLPRNGEGRNARCDASRVVFVDTTHLKATSDTQLEEVTRSADGRQETAEGLLAVSYESGRRQPHPFHHLPLLRTFVAPHRRRCIRYYKLPDAIVEKGNGAYPPRTLDCGTTKHRHPRFGPAT